MLSIVKQAFILAQTVSVEPMVFCYVMAKAMIDPALKNLEIEKSCRVNSNFSESICQSIIAGNYEQRNLTMENSIVQSYIIKMHAWQIPITNMVAIGLILVLGSLSDRHEIRKPFIIFTLFGQIVALSGCIGALHFMDQWPLDLLGFFEDIVYSLFGGEKMLLTVTYAYISDTSEPKMRTFRMSIVQAVWNISSTFGQLISAVLIDATNYYVIFLIALVLFSVALFYTIFMISEKAKVDSVNIMVDIFNAQYLKDTFKLLFKYTGTSKRCIILMLLVLYIYSVVGYGELSVFFLFTQGAYEWTASNYSCYYAVLTVANSIGLFVALPVLTNLLKVHDTIIICTSFVGKIVASLILLTIRTSYGLYISCIAGIFRTLAMVGIRSQLTKCVLHQDVGKVLSLYMIVDSLAELTSSQLYINGIYNHTRQTFPHAFLLLGIVLHFLGIAISMWIYAKYRVEEPIHNKQAEAKLAGANHKSEITKL